MECLLDTGARINVTNEDIFNLLNGLELRESRETLRCANNSRLEVLGKTIVDVRIGDMKEMVKFAVVKEMSPYVIGGM